MSKYISEAASCHRYGFASLMPQRLKTGSGMYGYLRPLYTWSIDGFKLLPFSALKNNYEDVV